VLNLQEKFLTESIKVDNKKGNLGESVKISRDGSSVTITSSVHFAKRYFKYLLKKYLKKNELREFFRVIAPQGQKNAFELRMFNMGEEEEADQE
jgi:large subunit ribosomal protein L22e